MSGVTIYEFDCLTAGAPNVPVAGGLHSVPDSVYTWLEDRCLRSSELKGPRWLRLTQRLGHRAVQVTSFVGVIRAPNGFQIEVLPKVGKAVGGGEGEARQLLVEMLCCLRTFRHVQTDKAKVLAARMPLLEVFIWEFLQAVSRVVKSGVRSDYSARQDNLFALRGKLLIASHLRENLHRADRFFTEHDEFSTDRPENRLLHAALKRVLVVSSSQTSQQLARELQFVFSEVPASSQPRIDFQCVRLDRGMGYYADALAWAELILTEESPLTGTGQHHAPSLLFPMEAVFEAFVAKHLARQIAPQWEIRSQAFSHHLVRHREQSWFRLKPDLVVRNRATVALVLDTKWKLLDASKANGTDKYGLAQSDFYQLQAYGQSYLGGTGHVVLIYPKTEAFESALDVFRFPAVSGLSLWVLPFCLKTKRLRVPAGGALGDFVSA